MALTRARTVRTRGKAKRRNDFIGRLGGRSDRGKGRRARRVFRFKWTKAVSEEQWAIYSQAIQAVKSTKVPFMLGGGFALAAFTGRWRDTKDIDFYIAPENRDRIVTALSKAGFKDYYDERPYDRGWIYRSVKSGVIVDIIWSMANRRAQVDELWFERAGTLQMRGQRLLIMPPEELMWCKLYILQRDHCDWTDLFNLLYAAGHRLDWRHVVERLEEDLPLLRGLLHVYGWICPKYVLKLPDELWSLLDMPAPQARPREARNHIRLLDSRGWFAALQSPHKKLEV